MLISNYSESRVLFLSGGLLRAVAVTAFLLLAVVACSPAGDKGGDIPAVNEPIFWPAPPEVPRVRYLYQFSKPSDLGFRTPLFKRFLNLIAGGEDRFGMGRPYAIAADESLIVVADPGLKSLQLFHTDKRRYSEITGVGGVELESPVGVALGPERIYVADSSAGRVFILDRNGKSIGTITDVTRPTGIALHRGSGRLYVADTLEHRIHIYDMEGKPVATFGARGGAAGEFNFPSHLALYGETLYVNDTMNFRIQAFDLDGRPLSAFGELGDGSGQFAQSKGVGMDSEGHIYVADALSNYVQIFDPEGRLLLAFGGKGSAAGEFLLPAGLFINRDRIYVVDSQNRRIQVFEYLRGDA